VGAEPRPPRRPPGIGAISLLAAVVVLVPGLVCYAALRALGLGVGGAGVLGLFVMIISMGCYPVILRRTGWVGPPRSRSPHPESDDADPAGGRP
jgi:hypothetical protein